MTVHTRTVKKTLQAKPVIEGAGVHLYRVFGFSEVPDFDPFLLLDDFRSDTPAHYTKGFPWHPHRGIETITYVTRGDVDHGDSLGNSGTISSGDVQWMTAGSGIVHQEMPKGDGNGRMHGFQLWANLPASEKMTAPKYRGIQGREIPELHLESGADLRIIAGSVNGVDGPVSDIAIKPQYIACSLPAGATFRHPTDSDSTAFIYVTQGGCRTGNTTACNRTAVLYDPGDWIEVTALGEDTAFLLLIGKPLREPIAWRGPIVMNTQQELETAFAEYRNGTFIKEY